MSDTKPTPGTWTVSELDSSGNVSPYHIFIEPGVAVIERKVDPVHDMAHARLIAAAPDLLAALRDLLVGAEAMGWPTAQARAAISRAEGEQ